MCDQGHSWFDIKKYTLGQFSIFLRNKLKNNLDDIDFKKRLREYERLQLIYDIRYAYHSDKNQFQTYVKSILNSSKPKNLSTDAAKELLAKGIAHGRNKNR